MAPLEPNYLGCPKWQSYPTIPKVGGITDPKNIGQDIAAFSLYKQTKAIVSACKCSDLLPIAFSSVHQVCCGHLPPIYRPMYSYSGQGCTKPGSKPLHHGIIHESHLPVMMLENEPNLGYPPVRAIMEPRESLTEASRMNYHKLATIEHNIAVRFIGELLSEDIPIACRAVQTAIAGGPAASP